MERRGKSSDEKDRKSYRGSQGKINLPTDLVESKRLASTSECCPEGPNNKERKKTKSVTISKSGTTSAIDRGRTKPGHVARDAKGRGRKGGERMSTGPPKKNQKYEAWAGIT